MSTSFTTPVGGHHIIGLSRAGILIFLSGMSVVSPQIEYSILAKMRRIVTKLDCFELYLLICGPEWTIEMDYVSILKQRNVPKCAECKLIVPELNGIEPD